MPESNYGAHDLGIAQEQGWREQISKESKMRRQWIRRDPACMMKKRNEKTKLHWMSTLTSSSDKLESCDIPTEPHRAIPKYPKGMDQVATRTDLDDLRKRIQKLEVENYWLKSKMGTRTPSLPGSRSHTSGIGRGREAGHRTPTPSSQMGNSRSGGSLGGKNTPLGSRNGEAGSKRNSRAGSSSAEVMRISHSEPNEVRAPSSSTANSTLRTNVNKEIAAEKIRTGRRQERARALRNLPVMVSVSPKYVGATRQKRRGPRRMVEPIQRFRDLGHHSHGLNVSKSADDPLLFRFKRQQREGGITSNLVKKNRKIKRLIPGGASSKSLRSLGHIYQSNPGAFNMRLTDNKESWSMLKKKAHTSMDLLTKKQPHLFEALNVPVSFED
mmetsp:Transcript_1912/g.2696  ORF Transcript_1912/g.2696 Transcript_1912/m.2696 type:complete len:384 (+) Transcript_1912:239-1390(+)